MTTAAPTTAVDRLNAIADTVKANFIQRDDVVELIKLSIVAGQNCLVIGPPGAAKTNVFTDFLSRLGGTKRYFKLTKGSTPEYLVGNMSVRALEEEDVFRYNTKGMLPDCHFAMIDEVFKGNALTRNAVVDILNEHVFLNADQAIECPLITCVAASNEFPDALEDQAFYDRFVGRMVINYLGDHELRMRMVRLALSRAKGMATTADVQLSLEDVAELQQRRDAVTIPASIDQLAGELYGALMTIGVSGVQIGDRRFAETFRLAAASAVMHGRTELVPDDLLVFQHTAWSAEEDRKEVQSAVIKTINPEIAAITDLFDKVEAGFEDFLKTRREAQKPDGEDFQAVMVANKLFHNTSKHAIEEMYETIIAMQGQGRDVTAMRDYYDRAVARRAEANRLAFGTDDIAGA